MKGWIALTALAGVVAGGCAAAPSPADKPCAHCERVAPFSSKARVEWENARWMCRTGSRTVDCVANPKDCKDCLAVR